MVIMYADKMSDAMNYAINETNRRRTIQETFNLKYNVTPITVQKDIRANISIKEDMVEEEKKYKKISKKDRKMMIDELESEMRMAAKNLDFERAAELRDLIFEIKSED